MMPRTDLRDASSSDIPAVLPLVREFYELFSYPFDEARKCAALSHLIEDPSLGWMTLGALDGRLCGYAVVTFSFSLELGGRTAFIDELYVAQASRGHGLGAALVRHIADRSRARGLNALLLETEDTNVDAARLYASLGFRSSGRHLMTLPLSEAPARDRSRQP